MNRRYTAAVRPTREPLVVARADGLYCAAGDFHIDAWRPVARNVITHAHADHARSGHAAYLAAAPGEGILRRRLGDISLELLDYGEPVDINRVRVSLHPAGHVLGSAQVRIEHRGEVWVVSGDYKLDADPTCPPFEPIRCDTFVTEATFGLPIYRWEPPRIVIARIEEWWRANSAAGRTSVLFAYALGKAQRILASVDSAIGPLAMHGAVAGIDAAYREAGVKLPPVARTGDLFEAKDTATVSRALVIAPPAAARTPWMRRFGEWSDGFASGWMQLRGARRRRSIDRGFVLSDHADWPGLLRAVDATGASRVLVTHGYTGPLARWLAEQGLDARILETELSGDAEENETGAADDA